MLVVVLAALPLLGLFLYHQLQYWRTKQFAAFPQLQPSLFWGHLKALHDFVGKGDPRRHIDQLFSEIAEHLDHPPLFLLDLRPVESLPLCVICDHEVAEQITRVSKDFPYSLPKAPTFRVFDPLWGPKAIISANGEEWKAPRRRFNPGFAPQHLVSLLPCILEKSKPFFEILDRHASSGGEFRLDELCVNLTVDIIGAVVMNEDLRAQAGPEDQTPIVKIFHELKCSYRLDDHRGWSLSALTRKRHRWNLSRRLSVRLKGHIRQGFVEQGDHKGPRASIKPRSVLALSLMDITKLDESLLGQICDQLKVFLFAGHDTTSILLQWAFYELSRTPRALQAIRDEVENLLGPDTSTGTMQDMILSAQGQGLLGKLVYTAAVIKETLRLHAPAGTARYVPPGTGFKVQTGDGRPICLDGVLIYNCETIIHRDESIYGPTKDVFVPERWLGDTSRIPPSAWRAFERGPRNCIGQELANIEAKVILACTVRRYDFTKVGLGEVACDESGKPIMGPHGQYDVKSQLFDIMEVTAKPVDGTRVRVAFAPGVRQQG